MASPNSSFTDIVTTTLQGYSGTIADNISNHNALLRQIDRKGHKRVATGRTIVQELEYAENATVMWYSGAETLDISPTETFTAAEFNYKQLAGNVTITGLEEIQNSGKEAVHNLLKSRIRNLEKSMKNTIATALYANGTGSSSKEVGGLQLLVADVPTNTVGGISGNSYPWWKNYVYDFSDNAETASTDSIQHAMNLSWINTVRGSDQADIITADANYYLYYLESLTPNQRFTDDKGAGAGFTNLVFQAKVPVIFDDQCPANHMYFLNTGIAGSLGYSIAAQGAGGTVAQNTSKSTGVTLNTYTGQITMNGAALAANTTVSFTLTNNRIAANDLLILNHRSGGTGGSYLLNPQCTAGSATINVRNVTAGSLSEAIVIAFTVIKGTTS